MRLATWNVLATAYIRPDYYPATPRKYLDPMWRLPAVIERARLLRADVLCLQEVEADTFRWLEQGLAQDGYIGVYAPRGGGRPDGCAAFWRRERFLLHSTQNMEYPDGSEHLAQWLELDSDGCRFAILNTHLKWDPPATPLAEKSGYRQARFASRVFDATSKPGRVEVVCGDFNAVPESDVLSIFREAGFRDPYEGFTEAFTCNANRRARRIDFLLVRGEIELTPEPPRSIDCETPLPSSEEPSDHLPLVVEAG